MIKIVGIAGSLRDSSYSVKALQEAASRVKALDAEVVILDLRDLQFDDV